MILKKPLFPAVFIIVLAIAILEVLAVRFFLFWRLPWFDIPMHFLGGFWISFAVLWFIFLSGYITHSGSTEKKRFVFIGLASAILIGVAWEIFEYTTGITFLIDHFVFDTVKDIIVDSIGGVVAALFIFSYFHSKIKIAQPTQALPNS